MEVEKIIPIHFRFAGVDLIKTQEKIFTDIYTYTKIFNEPIILDAEYYDLKDEYQFIFNDNNQEYPAIYEIYINDNLFKCVDYDLYHKIPSIINKIKIMIFNNLDNLDEIFINFNLTFYEIKKPIYLIPNLDLLKTSLKEDECVICYEITKSSTLCNHYVCESCFSLQIEYSKMEDHNELKCSICRTLLINFKKYYDDYEEYLEALNKLFETSNYL